MVNVFSKIQNYFKLTATKKTNPLLNKAATQN